MSEIKRYWIDDLEMFTDKRASEQVRCGHSVQEMVLASDYDALATRLADCEKKLNWYREDFEHAAKLFPDWPISLLEGVSWMKTQLSLSQAEATRLRECLKALWDMTCQHKITDLDAHAVIAKALAQPKETPQ